MRPIFKDRKKQKKFFKPKGFEYEFIDVLTVEGKERVDGDIMQVRERCLDKALRNKVTRSGFGWIGGEEYTMESLILAQDER